MHVRGAEGGENRTKFSSSMMGDPWTTPPAEQSKGSNTSLQFGDMEVNSSGKEEMGNRSLGTIIFLKKLCKLDNFNNYVLAELC